MLGYWKEISNRFNYLAMMACDVLRIPVTTIASESTFSIGSCVLNKYKSYMLDEIVQAFIFTHNWFLGFVGKFKFFIENL